MERKDTNDMLERARRFIQIEALGLQRLASQLTGEACAAVSEILRSRGKVVVSGVGKSRLVGEKISATLASTGTPSITLDPTDALHGDLGRVAPDDILLALSNSGETGELGLLAACVRKIPIPVIAMTGKRKSSLGELADIVLDIGGVEEACPFDLAPTTSTTAMMALGDALALVLQEQRGFTPEDFARLHPAGSLGKRLTRVGDVMRKDEQLPLVLLDAPLKDAIRTMYVTPGRPGAVLVVDGDTGLRGIFTAEDLRRVMRRRDGPAFSTAVETVMQARPTTVSDDMVVQDVFEISRAIGASQLPVLDHRQELVGLLEIGDIAALAPAGYDAAPAPQLSAVL